MSEEPDLVRLLYRADWTRLNLVAEVSVSQDPSRDPELARGQGGRRLVGRGGRRSPATAHG